MKKGMRLISIGLAACMLAGTAAACARKGTSSSASASTAPTSSASAAKDTITALLPPISTQFPQETAQYVKDFETQYPNLTLKVEPVSWDDETQKLDVQVNAGTPPDISFIASTDIPKYVSTGLLMDVSSFATSDMISDFDQTQLQYMKNGNGLYGFPAYMDMWALGGNKAMLEKAGIDWQSIQKNGWTWDQFRQDVLKGTVKSGGGVSRYGMVFACSGVTATDFLAMLVNEAGMPSPFTTDLKYAYTSKNFLTVLNGMKDLISDGGIPNNMDSVDAGARWNMFLTGKTMITGKGLATFEGSAKKNDAKLAAKDSTAVKDSIPVDYIILPMPTFGSFKQQATGEVDGYVVFRGKAKPSDEHMKNVVKAAYAFSSGKVAAQTNSELYVANITSSGREAAKSITVSADPSNAAEEARLVSEAAPARPDISSDLGDKATKIRDQVMVPKFQALLAGEITPQQMYDAVKAAAVAAFGQDGVVTD